MRLQASLLATAVVAAGLAASPAPAAGADSIVGIPAENVGVHGPIADHLRNLEVVAHSPIRPASETRDGLGDNGGIALVGPCAYVGRWHEYRNEAPTRLQHGLQVVDVDPASSTYTQVVGEVADSFVVGSTSREVRAVDLPGFKLLVLMTFSDNIANRPEQKVNTLRFFDASDCRNPRLIGTYDMLASRPHEFFLWLDPDRSHDVEGHPRILVYVTIPIEAPNMIVVDASNPALPHLAAVYDAAHPVVSLEEEGNLGDYLHSVSVSADGTRAYLSYWDGGYFTVDTTALALGAPAGAVLPLGSASVPYDYSPTDVGNTHSAVPLPGRDAVVVGDEVFGGDRSGCPYGWMRTIGTGSLSETPRQLGELRLDVNRPANCADGLPTLRNADGAQPDGTFTMHNQTVAGSFVLTSWYGGGMRVVDLPSLSAPVEVGAFVPKPLESVRFTSVTRAVTPQGKTASTEDDWWVETWTYPVIRDGLIYVGDIRNGLFILRPAPGSPFADAVAATAFAEGNSNVGALTS